MVWYSIGSRRSTFPPYNKELVREVEIRLTTGDLLYFLTEFPNAELHFRTNLKQKRRAMENGLLDSVDRVEISPEQFDLEAYISSYSGRSRIARLRFIAEKIASKDVQKDAISLALEEAKKGKDTGLYKDVASKAQEIFLDERKIEIDEQWISNQDNLANIRREKLEQDLTGYKVGNNLEIFTQIMCFQILKLNSASKIQ